MREVGSDGDMAAPCFRKRERERERVPHQCGRQNPGPATQEGRVQGGQLSEGHGGQEVLKVAQVLLLSVQVVKQQNKKVRIKAL